MATLTLYPLLSAAAPAGITLPGAWQGSWGETGTALGKALSSTPGTSQVSTSAVATGTSTTVGMGLGQFCSAPLAPGPISGTIALGYGVGCSTTGGIPFRALMYAAIMKGDGSGVRAVLLAANTQVTATNLTQGSEVTAFTSANSISTGTAAAGDYLLVEIGPSRPATGSTLSLYTDGTTAITTNNVATSDAKTFITFSIAPVFLSQVTMLYLRQENTPSGNLPGASTIFMGFTTVGNTNAIGPNARGMSSVAGSSQVASAFTGNLGGSNGGCLVQFISEPLQAQTLSAVTWQVGLALNVSSGAPTRVGGACILEADGVTKRANIFVLSNWGGVTAGSELTVWQGSIIGSGVTIQAGDRILLEFGVSLVGSVTYNTYTSGTTPISADSLATASAQSFILCSQPLLFIPPAIAGTANLGSGAGLAAAGVAQPNPLAEVSSLSSGSGLTAAGATALVKISGASSLGSGAGLTAAGVSTLVKISGTSSLGSGSGLAAAGVATVVHISGTATLGAGSGLTGAGTFQPGVANAAATFGSGASLAAAGAPTVVHVSASSSFGSGASLSAVGTFQPGVVSGVASLGAGAGLSGVGVPTPAGTAGLSGGSGLFAVGLPFPAITVATANLGSGSGLNAAGVAQPTKVSGTSSFGAGSGLAAQGFATIPTIFGTATLGTGSGLSAAGVAHTPAQSGTSSLGAGGGLSAQGVPTPVIVFGVSSFGPGAGLGAAGAKQLIGIVGVANLGSGSGLTAAGVPHGLFVAGAALLGSGGGLGARGVGVHHGTATFGAGANLSAMGGELSPPSPTIVTASVIITNLVTGSAIIVGIMSGSVISPLDEEEDIDTTG